MVVLYVVGFVSGVDPDVLDVLFTVNRYVKLLDEQYDRRREGLYELKYAVLNEIFEDTSRIEKHSIGGGLFYCLYFECERGRWSFHVPCNRIGVDEQRVVGGVVEVEVRETVRGVPVFRVDESVDKLVGFLEERGCKNIGPVIDFRLYNDY